MRYIRFFETGERTEQKGNDIFKGFISSPKSKTIEISPFSYTNLIRIKADLSNEINLNGFRSCFLSPALSLCLLLRQSRDIAVEGIFSWQLELLSLSFCSGDLNATALFPNSTSVYMLRHKRCQKSSFYGLFSSNAQLLHALVYRWNSYCYSKGHTLCVFTSSFQRTS